MYIWIFLATIMIALNFFNISPRRDKENAINEIKAAVVVNRFRAEHAAIYNTVKCDIIKHKDILMGSITDTDTSISLGTISKENGDYKLTDPVKNILGQNWGHGLLENNLPPGYDTSDEDRGSGLEVYHTLVCTKGKIDDAIITDSSDNNYNEHLIPCKGGAVNRYVISYAKIPDKWLSKIEYGTSPDVYKEPLPVLTNLISKSSSKGVTYGWTDCYNGTECDLHGYSSQVGTLIDIKEEDDDQASDEGLETEPAGEGLGTEPAGEGLGTEPAGEGLETEPAGEGLETEPADEGEGGSSTPKKNKKKKLVYKRIMRNSPVWQLQDFHDECSATPCLFAYERIGSDKGGQCRRLIQNAETEAGTGAGDGTEAGDGTGE